MLSALILLFGFSILPSTAANKTTNQKSTFPDVLVLVLNGMGSSDQVSINFNSAVSNNDAQKIMSSLASNSKWAIRNEKISTQGSNTPGGKPTTSINFQTPVIVSKSQGALPIEPFIIALKNYKNIQINFLVASQFNFKGLKTFENNYVKIGLQQSGNSYQYTINVKNSGFNKLDLSLTDDEKNTHNSAMPFGARILLTLGIAIGGAVIAYFIVAYFTKNNRRS